jgi:bifunctional non-homologous end joining protein LigD
VFGDGFDGELHTDGRRLVGLQGEHHRGRRGVTGEDSPAGAPGTNPAMARDSLKTYREKRRFDTTPEPRGDEVTPTWGRFVVQRHRARRLHYDFRLEIDGVLVSWAVPKGPTLDPDARRLAQQTEDHPIEYLDFEGVIPRGEYGGGDVIVWDRGTYEPADGKDVHEMLAKGDLHVDLHGEKLVGRFAIVRSARDSRQWLLIHKHDDAAVKGWDPEDHPASVKSGRTNDEVAADPDALWRSDRPAAVAEINLRDASTGATVRQKPPPKPPKIAKVKGATARELNALAEMDANGDWRVGARTVHLTNLDKVLFPPRDDEPPVTKRQLVEYFVRVGPTMVPYLADRPVNANRFPNGVGTKGFWQKEVPSHAPEWLRRWHNDDADAGESEWYAVVDDVPSLAFMANNAALELHPWTSKIPNVREPTWALIDIDPGTHTTFDEVLVLARLFRTALDHLGVIGRPKVSGQRGIQIYVPIRPGYTFDETRAWVERLSRVVGDTVPDLVSWKWSKSDRGGRARLDFTQNAVNRTLIAPYCTRPAPGAPVSVPLEWDELDDPALTPDRWTIRTVCDRIAEVGDPFRAILGVEQALAEI